MIADDMALRLTLVDIWQHLFVGVDFLELESEIVSQDLLERAVHNA